MPTTTTDTEASLLMVTGNRNKAREVEAITGRQVEAVSLDIPEIQSLDVEEVAAAKALSAYSILKKPVIVDDTGMAIDALKGLPGALVAWFLDTLGPQGVLSIVGGASDRRASVSTCIGFADQNGARTFVGTIHGTLSTELRGANGFGYDPIFIPNGHDKTYAEMSADEKNAVSMRAIALLKLREFLDEQSSN